MEMEIWEAFHSRLNNILLSITIVCDVQKFIDANIKTSQKNFNHKGITCNLVFLELISALSICDSIFDIRFGFISTLFQHYYIYLFHFIHGASVHRSWEVKFSVKLCHEIHSIRNIAVQSTNNDDQFKHQTVSQTRTDRKFRKTTEFSVTEKKIGRSFIRWKNEQVNLSGIGWAIWWKTIHLLHPK